MKKIMSCFICNSKGLNRYFKGAGRFLLSEIEVKQEIEGIENEITLKT
jgi:hypothetical protein